MSADRRLRPGDGRRFVRASIPRGWFNETAVIIGCGPSVNQRQINTVKQAFWANRCRVMVINRAYEIAPFADAMYAADERFWDAHISIVRDAHIPLLFCPERKPAEKYGLWWTPCPGENTAEGHAFEGLSEDPSVIHFGFHSGFQALNVVYHLAAKRIILLGYDCHHRGGTHYHGDHPSGWANAANPHTWIEPYRKTVVQFAARGIEVLNCSPCSDIDAFPMAKLWDIL